MAAYEYQCPAGHSFERFDLIRDWKPRRKCPECGKLADQIFSFTQSANPNYAFPQPDVYQNAAGELWYGGEPPAGFEKVEINSTAELRAFEQKVNQAEQAKADKYSQTQREHAAAALASRREYMKDILKNGVPEMDEEESRRRGKPVYTGRRVPISPEGRKFAEHAMAQTDARMKDRFKPIESRFSYLPMSYGRDGLDYQKEIFRERQEKINRERVKVTRRFE